MDVRNHIRWRQQSAAVWKQTRLGILLSNVCGVWPGSLVTALLNGRVYSQVIDMNDLRLGIQHPFSWVRAVAVDSRCSSRGDK